MNLSNMAWFNPPPEFMFKAAAQSVKGNIFDSFFVFVGMTIISNEGANPKMGVVQARTPSDRLPWDPASYGSVFADVIGQTGYLTIQATNQPLASIEMAMAALKARLSSNVGIGKTATVFCRAALTEASLPDSWEPCASVVREF